MIRTILLYGATGFTGRLIAAEGKRAGMARRSGVGEYRMVLAGRGGDKLEKVAEECGMEYRSFTLDDRRDVSRALRDVDVLINSAGPFALTADRLARSALDARCHYVDVNGEVDVYKRLDDFGRYAAQRKLAMVCSAGHTAAASDVLLDAALRELAPGGEPQDDGRLGAVRIAMSRVLNLSRGSAETLWRSVREQVTVVRTREVRDERGNVRRQPMLWHEPVGKLERTFDFGGRPSGGRRAGGGRSGGRRPGGTRTSEADLRIASAANLVDTLTARLTVARRGFLAERIESYVETGTVARIGYQLGTLLAPVAAMPWVRSFARQQIDFLPVGPTPQELEDEKQVVLLEIEDPVRTKVIDWRWETPNAYQFTAQVVLEIAKETAKDGAFGWLTPGAVFQPGKEELTGDEGALRDCRLTDRSGEGSS